MTAAVLASLLAPVTSTAQGTPPTLNVNRAIGNDKPFDVSDFAADITFIPLETGPRESLIGSMVRIKESIKLLVCEQQSRQSRRAIRPDR